MAAQGVQSPAGVAWSNLLQTGEQTNRSRWGVEEGRECHLTESSKIDFCIILIQPYSVEGSANNVRHVTNPEKFF